MGRIKYDKLSCQQNHKLHYGSGLPVFHGDIRQEGYGLGGLLSGLFRQVIPILKPVAKSLATTAFRTGGKVLSDVLTDKRSLTGALKNRVAESINDALDLPPQKKRKTVRRSRKRRQTDILD